MEDGENFEWLWYWEISDRAAALSAVRRDFPGMPWDQALESQRE
jgi:hypothetical protein